MKKLKIVVVGVGSSIFGRGTLADIISSPELQELDTTVFLVDIDKPALKRMFKLSNLFKNYFNSNIKIKATDSRIEAFKDANYIIASVAKKRYELWEQDFRIPLAYGFKHCLGENGGPGALLHTLRSLELMIPICKDIEKICPNALLLNFTNPESRVIMGVNYLTKVHSVGLCHGTFSSRDKISEILSKPLSELEIVSGGINHFFWVLKILDKKTGKDLYPEFKEKVFKNPKLVPPLVYKMIEIFGYFTYPSDDHIGEYLSFAYNFTGLKWYYGREYSKVHQKEEKREDFFTPYLKGEKKIDEVIAWTTGELAIPIIIDIEFDRKIVREAVNVLNKEKYVENLPEDAIVEVPALVDKNGIHPQRIGKLPQALADFSRTQISIQKLIIEAYKTKSKNLLLQALLLDPVVDNVENAEKMLDEMLRLQSEFLPEFK